MKKLCALLLALMLPLTAMSETHVLEARIHADESGFAALLTPLLSQFPEYSQDMNVDAVIELIPALLDGMGGRVRVQDDAFTVDFLLGGEALMDLNCYLIDNNGSSAITSALIPEYALLSTATDEDAARSALWEKELTNIDWTAVGNTVFASAMSWFMKQEHTTETGYFAGSVYEGGTTCTTWMFDDSDIADLVNAMLTEEVTATLHTIVSITDLDADAIIDELKDMNQRVAEANLFIYTFALVQNEMQNVIGASLTASHEGKRSLIISVGLNENGAQIAAALPLGNDYYWCDLDFTIEQQEHVSVLSGTYSEFAAPMDMSHAYAELAGEKVIGAEWRLNNTVTSADEVSWEGELQLEIPRFTRIESMPVSFSITTTGSILGQNMTSMTTVHAEDHHLLDVETTAAPCDTIPAMREGLIFVDMLDGSNENLDLLDQVFTDFSNALSVRLIKLLPLDLLFQVPDLLNIPE